jgi:rRNA-processing protein EBP2
MITETQKVEASDRARKQRQNKKFGKQIQQQILLKRSKAKSEAMADVTKGRKGLKQALANKDDGFDVEIGDDQPASKRQKTGGNKAAKDAKFGFGGKKNNSRGRSNNSDSYNQQTGKGDRFNVSKNKAPFKNKGMGGKSVGGSGKKSNAKPSRPGKSVRKGGGGRS